MDRYQSFSQLAEEQIEGEDFAITVIKQRQRHITVVAPHAGHIERGTSEFARSLAGEDLNLYLFEGLRASYNYENLHITSHKFDEPQCLNLVTDSEIVICIHGCNGAEDTLYLGGRHDELNEHLADQLNSLPIQVETENHRWPGRHQHNICNRGQTGAGVQIELSGSLRGGPLEMDLISTLRLAIFSYMNL